MADTKYYNNDIKQWYLSEREITNRNIRMIDREFFNIAKEYEERHNKDCSNFTIREILNMYSCCSSRSWEWLLSFNSQMKIYTAWCLMQNLVEDNQNHYDELDKHEMYNCLNIGLIRSMIVTRKELEKQLQNFYNVSDEFMALAFFEGFAGKGYKDFYNLSLEQFHGNEVDLGDRTITVSDLLIEKARESAVTYEKYNYNGLLKQTYRKNDPTIVKDTCNANTDTLTKNHKKILRRITILENDFGKAYGYSGMRDSGRIDMLKRLMKKDSSTDIRATYNKHKKEMEHRYGPIPGIVRWIEKYQCFFDDCAKQTR